MDTTEKTPPALQTKRFGATKGKFFNAPTWARFRLFIQYYNGSAKYASYDYTKVSRYGVVSKVRSELLGLTKLMELMHKKTKGKSYRYANIFCTIGADMNTTTGNFDYLVCTITPGKIVWKEPIYWKTDNNNMLDITKMKEYAKQKAQKQDQEFARVEVQKVLEQTLLPLR